MLEALSRFLAVAGVLLQARGAESAAKLGEVLRYGAILAREGDDARERLESVTEWMHRLVAEDRDPTPDEMTFLRDQRAELSARIQAVDLDAPANPEGSPT